MPKLTAKASRPRFAAMLLFQFRVVAKNSRKSNLRRTCEKRLIVFRAPTAAAALRSAKARARRAEFDYRNDRGGSVFFEFVGVLDLLKLGIECDPDEMWYDFCNLLKPMERKSKLLPAESKLNAIAAERARRGTRQPRRNSRRTHQNAPKADAPRAR